MSGYLLEHSVAQREAEAVLRIVVSYGENLFQGQCRESVAANALRIAIVWQLKTVLLLAFLRIDWRPEGNG